MFIGVRGDGEVFIACVDEATTFKTVANAQTAILFSPFREPAAQVVWLWWEMDMQCWRWAPLSELQAVEIPGGGSKLKLDEGF